jgi:hypothetical protein
MFCIDYSDDEALQLLRSDPSFEVLQQTRYTSLVLFANGTHGVFFSCEVDEARASFQPGASADNTQDGQDGITPLTTDDGSRLLTPAEITSLRTEINTLVASLPIATQPTPLVPRAPSMLAEDSRSDAEADAQWHSSSAILLSRSSASRSIDPAPEYGPRNRHPYMCSPDWSTRYHAVADPPVPHESSSVDFFTPTQAVFGGWRQPGQVEDPILGRWLQDPDADIALPFLRCYGRNAVALLLADPGARSVKRGTLTSLVKFSDEIYCVLRNEDIDAATGKEHEVVSMELQHRLAMHQIQHIGLRHQLMEEITRPLPPPVPLPS